MVHQSSSVPNGRLLHKTSMISTLNPRYIELSFDLLHQKYVVEGQQTSEIARQVFSSNSRIRDALKAFGIPLRKRKNFIFNKTNTPFGKRLTPAGHLEDCPEEMEAIDLMIKMQTQGHTFKAIGDELKRKGVKTKMGRDTWSPESIKRAIYRATQEDHSALKVSDIEVAP